VSWDGGKEQRENELVMDYNQDPRRAAKREEKAKPETGIRAAKTRQNACSKTLGEGESCGLPA